LRANRVDQQKAEFLHHPLHVTHLFLLIFDLALFRGTVLTTRWLCFDGQRRGGCSGGMRLTILTWNYNGVVASSLILNTDEWNVTLVTFADF